MEDLDLAERYLDGRMGTDQQRLFEVRLSADPLLASQVQELRMISTGIGEAMLVEQMQRFHAPLTKEKGSSSDGMPSDAVDGDVSKAGLTAKKKKASPVVRMDHSGNGRIFRNWMVAASVLVIAVIGFWMVSRAPAGDSQLYTTYFNKDPGFITAMSSTQHYDFDRAMVDYKSGEYDAAIGAWTKMAVAGTANDTLDYFIASAYMADQQQARAIPFFEKVLKAPAGAFTEEANWYLGLALVKLGKWKEAIPYLEKSSRNEKVELIGRLQK